MSDVFLYRAIPTMSGTCKTALVQTFLFPNDSQLCHLDSNGECNTIPILKGVLLTKRIIFHTLVKLTTTYLVA